MASFWALRRQFLFLLIFIVILFIGLVLFGIWYNRPTCFDNKQNQNEEGVDCGGPCAKQCLGDIRNLNVLWTKFFKIGEGRYDVAAMIKNPNAAMGLASLKYRVNLYDKDNILIVSKQGETFITPDEIFPIFEGNIIVVGSHLPSRVSLEFEQNPNWQKARIEKFSLVVSKKQFFNEMPFPKLVIGLENKSINPAENIFMAVVLYDQNGNAEGASITKVDSVSEEAPQDVIFTWPQPLAEAPASIEIFFKSELKQ